MDVDIDGYAPDVQLHLIATQGCYFDPEPTRADLLSDALFLTTSSSFYDACELLTKREYFHIPIVREKPQSAKKPRNARKARKCTQESNRGKESVRIPNEPTKSFVL